MLLFAYPFSILCFYVIFQLLLPRFFLLKSGYTFTQVVY